MTLSDVFTGFTSNLTRLEAVLTALLAVQGVVVQLASGVPAAAHIVSVAFAVLGVVALIVKNTLANVQPAPAPPVVVPPAPKPAA